MISHPSRNRPYPVAMGHNELRMAIAHPRIREDDGVGLCRLRPAHDTFKQNR